MVTKDSLLCPRARECYKKIWNLKKLSMKSLEHVHRNSPGKCHVAFCYKFADHTCLCSVQKLHQCRRWEENKRTSLKVSTDQHKSLFHPRPLAILLLKYWSWRGSGNNSRVHVCRPMPFKQSTGSKRTDVFCRPSSVVECVISYVIHDKHCKFTLRKVTGFLWIRGGYSKESFLNRLLLNSNWDFL